MVSFRAHWRSLRALNVLLLASVCAPATYSQVIDFESNGLHYQAMTRSGVTITFAKLPPHISEYNVMQVTVTNGSPISWTVRPEDFTFVRPDGTSIKAMTADSVIEGLLSHASKSDVVKLQVLYESSIYALPVNYRSTASYEHRRESAMTVFVNPRFKAAAAASAITFVPTKLKPGDSTDGAIFFFNREKVLGQGRLLVHAAGENYSFDVFPDVNFKSR
jgi:hypothetical protein